MPICNRFHERLANNGQITTYTGYHSLMPSCAGFLESRKIEHWAVEMLKILYTASPCLLQLISAQFAIEMMKLIRHDMSRSPKSPKIHKNPYFGI